MKQRLLRQTLVTRTSAQKKRKWARADEMEAQRGARPNLSPKRLLQEDPKTATAKPDQPPAAAGIPSEPPQSPKLHNTDA